MFGICTCTSPLASVESGKPPAASVQVRGQSPTTSASQKPATKLRADSEIIALANASASKAPDRSSDRNPTHDSGAAIQVAAIANASERSAVSLNIRAP
jgi:hypothetical protein